MGYAPCATFVNVLFNLVVIGKTHWGNHFVNTGSSQVTMKSTTGISVAM